jgi:hypothetical protein
MRTAPIIKREPVTDRTAARLMGEPASTEAGPVVDAPTHPPVTRRVENLRSVTADIEG